MGYSVANYVQQPLVTSQMKLVSAKPETSSVF